MATELARQEPTERAIGIADPEEAAAALAHLLGTGDLSRLTPSAKVALYLDTCKSLSLNPRTRPLDWIEFYDPETKGKKLALYPNRSCAEQLRRQHQISVKVVKEEIVGDLFKVTVEGRTPNGRTDEATAYVSLTDRDGNRLRGDRLGNAFMKAQTKAKRRLTFSMVGMASPPDPEELRAMRPVIVDGTGRVLESPTDQDWAVYQDPGMAKMLGVPTYEDTHDSDSPLAGTTGQQVKADELQQAQRPAGPAPSFRASDEEVRRWLGAWFAAVKGTSLDDDDARHRFVGSYSDGRTDSLRGFLSSATERQAGDFLAHVRALADAERAANASQAPVAGREWPLDATEEERGTRPSGMTPEGHAAAVLTGAPATAAREEEAASPELFDPDRTYSRPELFDLYEHWASRMTALDSIWRADDVKRLPDTALRAAVVALSSQVTDLEDHLARFGADEETADDAQAETETAF